MKWIFSVRVGGPSSRHAVVGPASLETVEVALKPFNTGVSDEIRADEIVRLFVEGRLDPARPGYYIQNRTLSSFVWLVCIGPVHEVLP